MQISQEVLDYINGSYLAKKSKELIIQEMRGAGYQEEYITQAFLEYEGQTNQSLQEKTSSIPSIPLLIKETLLLYGNNFFRIFFGQLVIFVFGIASCILLTIVFALIVVLTAGFGFSQIDLENITSFFSGNTLFLTVLLGVIIVVFLFLLIYLQVWLQLSWIYFIGGLEQKRRITESIRLAFPRTLQFYWTQLLFNILCFIGALFLPLLVVLFTWFSLYIFTFTEERIAGSIALLKTKTYVQCRFFPVLWRISFITIFGGILMLAINIIGSSEYLFYSEEIIPILLITIFFYSLIPLLFIYFSVLYTHLKNTATPTVFSPSKKSQIIIALSPVFVLCLFIGLFLLFRNSNGLQIP